MFIKRQSLVILGGTGFVGHHLVPRLVADDHAVLLLSRNRERHRDLAVLPNVRLRSVDVHDGEALHEHFAGADAVLNLVGILNEGGRQSFQRAHVELTATVIDACRAAGVRRLHQMSSLKAGQGPSRYLRTRGEAEQRVRTSGLAWTIYRPSVIFGPGDGLVTRFAGLLRASPVLPLARAGSRMAPVDVGDVVEAIARCIADPARGTGQVFELAGPDVYTLGRIVRMIRDAAGLRRAILPLPDALGWLQAAVAGLLPGKPFSLDNFRSLSVDSVADRDGLAALGITPHRLADRLPALLGRGRQGAFDLYRTRSRGGFPPPPRR